MNLTAHDWFELSCSNKYTCDVVDFKLHLTHNYSNLHVNKKLNSSINFINRKKISLYTIFKSLAKTF